MLTIAILSGFASQVCASTCDRFAESLTTVPAPFQSVKTIQRSERVLKKIPAKADVIIVGDSLAAMWPQTLAQAQFGTPNVWNFGIIGAVTQSVIWQIKTASVGHLRPAKVVIIVGTNNLNLASLPPCAVSVGIEGVAMTAQKAWPSARIVIMGIPPRGLAFDFRAQDRAAVNAQVREWAATRVNMDFFQLDPDVITCGLVGSESLVLGSTAVPSEGCSNYRADLLHFTPAGYLSIFDAMPK